MTIQVDSNRKRSYVAPGELRADLLDLFSSSAEPLDVLLAPPGLLAVYPSAHAEVVRRAHVALSVQEAGEYQRSMLEWFQQQVDAIPQEVRWRDIILRWCDKLGGGGRRVFFYPHQQLHSRLLSRPEESIALQGPLTMAALKRPRGTELDLILRGPPHEQARRWFEARRAEAVDISPLVKEILATSWAGDLIHPRDLYHKVLAEYFRDTLEGMDVEADHNPMLDVLTDFQAEAYHYAKGILRRFGGVILADVVGLGKTFIGMALLQYVQARFGLHAVVVAPPAVCAAWEELARDCRVEIQTVSFGKLEELENHQSREVLLIDESHNFRHTDTRRYELVRRWLNPDGIPSNRKVILISATPQNNRPRDVLNQLRLFPTNYCRLPYRGESLDDFFQRVETGREQMTSLLQHVVVRRTRRFIQAAYPDAVVRQHNRSGQLENTPLRFPSRLSGPDQCLRYSIDKAYRGNLYDRLLVAIRDMHYPLYGLVMYVLPRHAGHPDLSGLTRAGRSIRGLFKVLLLKRLESSFASFQRTLLRLRERLLGALQLLTEQDKVQVRRLRTAWSTAEDESIEEEAVLPGSYFNITLFRAHLEHDLKLVDTIVTALASIKSDPKLARLRQFLAARPPSEHRTVIFSQFADTVAYLHEQLADEPYAVEKATGQSRNLLDIARRFSPLSNRRQVPRSQQIDLLISTDALSEGTNLQDADTLINYDLHWNPVRLIQRAGRIDRIGSQNTEIQIASFLPERELEAELGLEAVLRVRIREFIDVFGEDNHVLPAEEVLGDETILNAYTGRALELADESDDMDGLSRYAEEILNLRRTDPASYNRIMSLRLGRRAVSQASAPGIVATRIGWYWEFWCDGKSAGSLDRVEPLDALEIFHRHAEKGPLAEPAPSLQMMQQLGELVESARRAFSPLARVAKEQRAYPQLNPAEDWVRAQLEEYRNACLWSQRPQVKELLDWVMTGQQKQVLRSLAAGWRREQLSAAAVFHEARGLMRRFPVSYEIVGSEELIASVMGVKS